MGVKILPQAPAAHAPQLRLGDKVELDAQQGRLVAAPVTRLKYSLDDLLAMQGNEPLTIDREWDAMPATGKEVGL